MRRVIRQMVIQDVVHGPKSEWYLGIERKCYVWTDGAGEVESEPNHEWQKGKKKKEHKLVLSKTST